MKTDAGLEKNPLIPEGLDLELATVSISKEKRPKGHLEAYRTCLRCNKPFQALHGWHPDHYDGISVA